VREAEYPTPFLLVNQIIYSVVSRPVGRFPAFP